MITVALSFGFLALLTLVGTMAIHVDHSEDSYYRDEYRIYSQVV